MDWERVLSRAAAAYLLVVQLVLLGVSTGTAAGHQLDGTGILCNGVVGIASGGLPGDQPGARDLCCIVLGGLPAMPPLDTPSLERPVIVVLDATAVVPVSQSPAGARPAAHGARAPPVPPTV